MLYYHHVKANVEMPEPGDVWKSPVWFVPVALLAILCFIEIRHLSIHGEYCKTESEWMNDRALEYDRESSVE